MAQRSIYQDEIVYLTDLLDREALPPVLNGFRFVRCQIRGPVVVTLMRDTQLVASSRHLVPDREALFFEFEPDVIKVGVVGLADCLFEECAFEGVGFAGTRQALDELRLLFA